MSESTRRQVRVGVVVYAYLGLAIVVINAAIIIVGMMAFFAPNYQSMELARQAAFKTLGILILSDL